MHRDGERGLRGSEAVEDRAQAVEAVVVGDVVGHVRETEALQRGVAVVRAQLGPERLDLLAAAAVDASDATHNRDDAVHALGRVAGAACYALGVAATSSFTAVPAAWMAATSPSLSGGS